ncbi:MAG TPA: SAM-dependent methyltransferase [Polyangiales bacterium]|nr:SAM-dependent methyltransferase [Polyangiales bacterium]
MNDPIRNVSGTAFWAAEYRVMQTAQPFPLFRDPWAAALAGTRGREVMRALRGSKRSEWAVSMRTLALDQLLVEGLAEHGYDTVINLGAGLDARAFRLPLPQRLRWFDVDMPEIIAHRQDVLRDAAARCDYRALKADLSVDAVRKQTIAQITRDSSKTLVITEGLLEYLTPEAVHGLARELRSHAAVHSWLCNLMSPSGLRQVAHFMRKLDQVNARILFTPEGPEVFRGDGWCEMEWVSLLTHGMVYRRVPMWMRLVLPLLRFAPPAQRERVFRSVGVARLQRDDLVLSRQAQPPSARSTNGQSFAEV